MLANGQVLQDRWKVIDRIGQGGMATVYLVKDLRLEKIWALKEVPIKSTPQGKIHYQSVVAETNLLKSLNYAGIPSIVEIMRTSSSLLIVMDYIDGKSLREVIAETYSGKGKNYLKEKYIVKWGISLCKILRYLHNHEPKIIYRDMKPQNIMLNNQNEIKLLDFGIAVALTDDFDYKKAGRLGTKGFASPEQSKKDFWFDERSDIYALGKTLYYLATGWSPSSVGADKKLIPLKPVRTWDAGRSVGLETIIHKAIEKDPEKRYQNVDEMLYDLEHIEELSTEYKQKMSKRFTVLISLCGTFLAGLVLGTYGLISNKLENGANYQTYLETGRVSQDPKDFIRATAFSGSEVDPYMELMQIYKQDSVFSKDEEEEFLSALQPNVTKVQYNKRYGDFAFEVGKLYWFNYLDSGTLRSVSWFQKAVEHNSRNKELAQTYLEIGKFQQSIISAISDLSDDGMYKVYWEALQDLDTLGSKDDQVRLMLVQSTFDVIEAYSNGLKSDGLSYNELSKTLDKRIDLLVSLSPKNSRLVDLKEELVARIDVVRLKLDTAYGKRG